MNLQTNKDNLLTSSSKHYRLHALLVTNTSPVRRLPDVIAVCLHLTDEFVGTVDEVGNDTFLIGNIVAFVEDFQYAVLGAAGGCLAVQGVEIDGFIAFLSFKIDDYAIFLPRYDK